MHIVYIGYSQPAYIIHSSNSLPCLSRYTVFIPIYPAGVVSEMKIILTALPMLAAPQWWSLELPNASNWAFSYRSFMVVVLGLYPILWWQLYSTLLAQRKKKLNVQTHIKKA